MTFTDLSEETKENYYEKVSELSESLGGMNFFLQLIEEMRESKVHPFLNRTNACRYKKGRIRWQKPIYKETIESIKEMIYIIDPKKLDEKTAKKRTNLLKVLKPIEFTLTTPDEKVITFHAVTMIDENNSDFSILFKVIFFYPIEFIKNILKYKK